MTEKEKELRELERILYSIKIGIYRDNPEELIAQEGARKIILAGYTKRKFDVEELKRWVNVMQELNEWEGKYKPKSVFQIILNKIKEIEG